MHGGAPEKPILTPALAAASLLRRFRFGVLAVFLSAGLLAILRFPPDRPGLAALAMLGGGLAAWLWLRHFGLALAVMLAPLPAFLWHQASAYALALCMSFVMASGLRDAMLRGETGFLALWRPAPAMIWTLLFAQTWSWQAGLTGMGARFESLLAALLSVLVLLPVLASLCSFGEDFITRANRQREAMLRGAAFLAHLGEPRWAVSLSGVLLVLGVLRLFQIAPPPPLVDLAMAGLLGGIVLVSTRDGRSALAASVSGLLLISFVQGVNGAALLFLFFALILGRAAAAHGRAGDMPDLAWSRALEDHGGTLAVSAAAMVAAVLVRGGVQAGLHLAAALVAALLFFPALAGLLHHWFPARRHLERRYRV